MNWFLAKIVYRIVCGEGSHTPQFDEQLRLISADNETEAFTKAQTIGRLEEEAFYNQECKMVQWQFINVSELYRISALIDGAELYSAVQEAENAGLYIDMVHKKASNIQANITHKYLQLY